VFFNFFAAAEPYKSVKITHGTPWHAMICEFNGVGLCKVEFSGCFGTDVLSGVERQKTCGNLEQNPETLTIKQHAKDLFNFTHCVQKWTAKSANLELSIWCLVLLWLVLT